MVTQLIKMRHPQGTATLFKNKKSIACVASYEPHADAIPGDNALPQEPTKQVLPQGAYNAPSVSGHHQPFFFLARALTCHYTSHITIIPPPRAVILITNLVRAAVQPFQVDLQLSPSHYGLA